VVRYRVAEPGRREEVRAEGSPAAATAAERPEDWAFRLTEKLRGLLKEEIAQYGGTEGYIRWVRGYDEEEQ
jgi:hypothetical protein